MLHFKHFGADDLRDQICALLSVAGDSQWIVPDYTKSVEEVYEQVFNSQNSSQQIYMMQWFGWMRELELKRLAE